MVPGVFNKRENYTLDFGAAPWEVSSTKHWYFFSLPQHWIYCTVLPPSCEMNPSWFGEGEKLLGFI